jgi:Holliday junction resolvase RusA-like endonuclease
LRPRKIHGGKLGVWMPGTAKEWRQCVEEFAEPHRPDDPIDYPVTLRLIWLMPRPNRLSRKKDPDGIVWCDQKPDIDNLAKSTIDAKQTAGWFSDDRRVVNSEMCKVYHAKGGVSGAIIEIDDARPMLEMVEMMVR